ncbi:hypothetical protein ACWEFJ_25775 [Actinosynnema sp. NPDC004786]
MSATPPGVEELDPARAVTDELEEQFAGEDPADGVDPTEQPDDDLPVAPTGHHQTHGVPADVTATPVAGD